MNFLAKFYDRLPIFAQNLGVSAYGAWVDRQRYGGDFAALMRGVSERERWPAQNIAAFQTMRLKVLLRHAVSSVPYYSRLVAGWERGLTLHPGHEAFQSLPVLTKEKARSCQRELLGRNLRWRQLVHCHTSGTTGAGWKFVVDREAYQEQWAVWWRHRMRHSIQPGTWCAYFGGRSVVPVEQSKPPFWRINRAARQVLYSTYHLSPSTLGRYVNDLKERKLAWIHGYPSALSLLAQYVLDSGDRLRFSWATVGAESLMPWQRKLIEEAFGCRCRQHYGSAEGVANFSECEAGNLHADEDFCVVELLPAALPGQFFILGTSLANYAMPLLRYHTGDICGRPLEACPCGRWGMALAAIDGRQEDYVLLRDGRILGRLDHVFKDAVNVREAQIVQSEPGQAVVRVVAGFDWTWRDEAHLREEFRKRTGPNLKVEFQLCEKLPRTPSGKLRFVVSNLPGEGLGAAEPLKSSVA